MLVSLHSFVCFTVRLRVDRVEYPCGVAGASEERYWEDVD